MIVHCFLFYGMMFVFNPMATKKDNPSYYAIIPADVRYSNIPANAKLLYGEITALCNKEGYCWASNNYFAKLYKVNPTTISAWVKNLRDEGFIFCEVIGKDRKMMLREKPKHASGKAEADASGKAEHNTTRFNNTNNEEPLQSKGVPVSEIDIRKIIDAFAPINGTFIRFYKLKKQREATKNLIRRFGVKKLLQIVSALPYTNGKVYAPTITTPDQLETKVDAFLAYYAKERDKIKSKERGIII